MLLKKTCISSNNLSENVHLKVFWTLFKNVHCRGPWSLRPCISRPYCIHLSSVQFLFVSSSHCNFPVHICSAVQYKAWNILVIFQAFAFTLRLKCIRARSLIMMTKFCPLLTTNLPPVDNCVGTPSLLQVNLCQKLLFLQNMGRICCVHILFWMSKSISVHNISPNVLSLEYSCIELVIQWTICRHIVG